MMNKKYLYVVLLSAFVLSEILAFLWASVTPETCNSAPFDPFSFGHFLLPFLLSMILLDTPIKRFFSMLLPIVMEICWEFIERSLEYVMMDFACESFGNIIADVMLAVVAVIAANILHVRTAELIEPAYIR